MAVTNSTPARQSSLFRPMGAAASQTSNEDKPKAEYWLNVGYCVDVEVEAATKGKPAVTERRFVSLPVGIPLDTMELVPSNSRNANWAMFQTARNELRDDLLKGAAEALKPGDDMIIAGDAEDPTSLCLQIRRVGGEIEPVATENNPFSRKPKITIVPDAE